jgi:hypothetical protein
MGSEFMNNGEQVSGSVAIMSWRVQTQLNVMGAPAHRQALDAAHGV